MNADFDLMMETQLLMQRTNQLVGLQKPTSSAAAATKAADQEWVI